MRVSRVPLDGAIMEEDTRSLPSGSFHSRRKEQCAVIAVVSTNIHLQDKSDCVDCREEDTLGSVQVWPGGHWIQDLNKQALVMH